MNAVTALAGISGIPKIKIETAIGARKDFRVVVRMRPGVSLEDVQRDTAQLGRESAE